LWPRRELYSLADPLVDSSSGRRIYATYTPYARGKKNDLDLCNLYSICMGKKGKKKVDINKRIMLGGNRKQE
jgi:hypothetical protein